MLAALSEGGSGASTEPATSAQISEWSEAAERSAGTAHEAEIARRAAEAAAESARDRAEIAEVARRSAQEKAAALRKQVRNLQDERRGADAVAEVELRTREAELTAQRLAAEEIAVKAAAESIRLQTDLDEKLSTQREALARQAFLERQVEDLQHRLTQAQAFAVARSLDAGVEERIRAAHRRVREALISEPDDSRPDGTLPRPGEVWPYRRGDDVWTITADRQMLRRSDSTILAEFVGRARAGQLIDEFLLIRPSGGRVWIDEDTDAVTYVGETLVYLGRLVENEPSAAQIALGTPLGDFRGSKYDLGRRGIVHRATGTSLATVIGGDAARAVAARLLQIRPSGGVYRVNDEGVAATWLTGQWVYAGSVGGHEWFPGHVRRT